MAHSPHVLVVDADGVPRTALVATLDARGCTPASADGGDGALAALATTPSLSVVVLAPQPSAADDRELVHRIHEASPSVRIVLRGDRAPFPGAVAVSPADEDGLFGVIGACPHVDVEPVSAAGVIMGRLSEIEHLWAELCHWDPAQPPDAVPAVPRLLLRAVADSLRHPQPVGWGLDPALDDVVEAFAAAVASPDQAIAQLSCLRRALHDVVVRDAPLEERDETITRMSAVLDHTMLTAASLRTSHLYEEALTDALTGLGNRRAFDRDLERDIARARRAGSPLTLAVIDLDGLKRINDDDGHAAGDRAIARMGAALRATSRRSDRAYRIGGDEFAVLLAEAVIPGPDLLAERLAAAGAPACTVGVASAPPDPLDELFEVADRALYRTRALRRSG